MSLTPALLALLVILVFVSIVVLMIKASRKIVAEKTHLALSLGFEQPPELPLQLATRVEELYRRKDGQAVYIDGVYHKSELNQELFIFDVRGSAGNDSEMGSEVFGVISRELALPRFSLITMPGFSREGLLGGLMDKLLDKVLELAEKYQGLSRIEFPDRPDFDEQVIVFGRDEYAVRELLRGVHLGTLAAGQSPFHIAGSGDFLTVDFSLPSSSSSSENDLISHYQQFTQIYRVFLK
jgi:hypothetical protein